MQNFFSGTHFSPNLHGFDAQVSLPVLPHVDASTHSFLSQTWPAKHDEPPPQHEPPVRTHIGAPSSAPGGSGVRISGWHLLSMQVKPRSQVALVSSQPHFLQLVLSSE
jgi:hypothetical protein